MTRSSVFLSLADRDKEAGLRAAVRFVELGFSIAATSGTAAYLEARGVPVETIVAKVGTDGARGQSFAGAVTRTRTSTATSFI